MTGTHRIPELSVTFPVLNEQQVLPSVLEEDLEVLPAIADRWELVVVDDGSTDRTPDILREAAEREPRLRIVTHPRPMGYGAAVRDGLAETSLMVVLMTDGDGQFDIRDAADLFPLLQRNHLAVGYRYPRHDPWGRRAGSKVYNAMASWVLGRRIRDVNCSMKLMRRSVLEMVDLSSDDWLIDAELMARARRAGLEWGELPVSHRSRPGGESKVRPADFARGLRGLWTLRRLQ
jgi:glycosyltransferase involved in cell wall biosynthesis